MDSRSVIAELTAIYDAAVERLRADIADFVRTGILPPPERRRDGSYCYPELRIGFSGGGRAADRSRAFGRLHVERSDAAFDLTAHVLHAHDLLPEITALGPAHGSALEGGLVGPVLPVKVRAEFRHSTLEAQP